MATRIFCDHCGLKIPSATKFFFGKCPTNQPMAQQAIVQAAYQAQQYSLSQNIYQGSTGGLLGGSGGSGGYTVTTQPAYVPSPVPAKSERYYATVEVDLCEVCVPIWYERANNLCKANKD